MLEELKRRNYAGSLFALTSTQLNASVNTFIVGPISLARSRFASIRAALFTRWKLAPNTVTQRLAALRFFYVPVLKRGWSVAETPYPEKVLHLPQVLSQEEVAHLIDAAESPFHRILLMTLYATGARRASGTSRLLRAVPPLSLRFRTLALVVLPLVASPFASESQVPTFRSTASLASSGHLSCRMPLRP